MKQKIYTNIKSFIINFFLNIFKFFFNKYTTLIFFLSIFVCTSAVYATDISQQTNIIGHTIGLQNYTNKSANSQPELPGMPIPKSQDLKSRHISPSDNNNVGLPRNGDTEYYSTGNKDVSVMTISSTQNQSLPLVYQQSNALLQSMLEAGQITETGDYKDLSRTLNDCKNSCQFNKLAGQEKIYYPNTDTALLSYGFVQKKADNINEVKKIQYLVRVTAYQKLDKDKIYFIELSRLINGSDLGITNDQFFSCRKSNNLEAECVDKVIQDNAAIKNKIKEVGNNLIQVFAL